MHLMHPLDPPLIHVCCIYCISAVWRTLRRIILEVSRRYFYAMGPFWLEFWIFSVCTLLHKKTENLIFYSADKTSFKPVLISTVYRLAHIVIVNWSVYHWGVVDCCLYLQVYLFCLPITDLYGDSSSPIQANSSQYVVCLPCGTFQA